MAKDEGAMRLAVLETALSALKRGDIDEFVRLIPGRAAATQMHAYLGRQDPEHFDLLRFMLQLPHDKIPIALDYLLPAVEYFSELVEVDAIRLLHFAERVERSYIHRFFRPFSSHVGRRPPIGRELGNAIVRGELAGDLALRVWAIGFCDAAPNEAAAYAADLLTASSGNMRIIASIVASLPKNAPDAWAVLQPHEELLSARLGAMLTGIDSETAGASLTALALISSSATQLLLRSLAAGVPAAATAFARWLVGTQETTFGSSAIPLDEIAKRLLSHGVSHPDSRSEVDDGISTSLYTATQRDFVLPCLDELQGTGLDVSKEFPRTVEALAEDGRAFAETLSRWLVAEDADVRTVRSLLTRCFLSKNLCALHIDTLANAAPSRLRTAARRLLALTPDGEALCRFIPFFAETPQLQPAGLDIAREMLEFTREEYPDATEAFLESRTRGAERRAAFAPVYRGIYASTLRWRRVLKRLPVLNELRPSELQQQALRLFRHRTNREIIRGAQQKSVFASIFQSAHLAQGRQFAMHTFQTPARVMQMQQTSRSFALPSSETADPMGGAIRRRGLLRDHQ